jgi:2-keto-4-pentenoate hydratase
MPLDPAIIQNLAERYLVAERDATPMAPWHNDHPGLIEDEVYMVQAALLRLRHEAGGTLAGWKAGATNPGAQAAFGLTQAVYGRLLGEMRLADGDAVPRAALIHPRLECEVAFVLGADLGGPGVTPELALAAVERVVAAFEIVDSRTTGWAATMPEMIADNVFQARYLLSPTLLPGTGLDLAAIEVVLTKNGVEAARAKGSNVLGSPANALAWLANRVAEHGHRLRAGDIVLAGSLTPLVACESGDSFTATFDHLGSITISFT